MKLDNLRLAILSLGYFSHWSRASIRAMNPGEFASYLDAARELAEKTHGA